MGGHGGLNILPQKKWNVYNFDNREKVRKDEEAAAKDEQLKREQSRRRDSELRLEQLRRARGLDPGAPPPETPASAPAKSTSIPIASTATKSTAIPEEPKSDSNHINLFDGIKIFDPVAVDGKRKKRRDEEENDRRKKMKKEEVRVVGPEDEVYRLGYGVAGKGVTAPWYTKKREVEVSREQEDEEEDERERKVVVKKKKSVEELREERLKREKAEKERQWALVSGNAGIKGGLEGTEKGGNGSKYPCFLECSLLSSTCFRDVVGV